MLRILLLIGLLINLILTTSLNTYAETTGNLVSQNFTTGWSGTNSTSLHGTNTIAGVHGQYLESDSVSLNSSGINKESLNQGFTVTGTANYWFWSGAQQSVTQTIKTVDDNNNTLTQTRVISGTSGSGNTYDQLIVSSNTQQDYNVSLRYDFSVPTYPTYHYAADLSAPSLTVNYTYVAPLDTSTKTELFALNTTITNDLKDVKEEVKLDTNISKTTDVATAPISNTNKTESTTTLINNKENLDTNSSTKENSQENVQTDKAQSSEEKSESGADDKSSEQETKSSEGNTQTTSSDKNDKSQSDAKTSSNVSSADTIKSIDVKVKDPGKNLELKHLVMLDKMIDNSALLNYANIPFYKDKKIYEEQINISDNRILYPNVSLISYTQNDPVYQKEKLLFDIRQEKQKLIKELWSLQNAG